MSSVCKLFVLICRCMRRNREKRSPTIVTNDPFFKKILNPICSIKNISFFLFCVEKKEIYFLLPHKMIFVRWSGKLCIFWLYVCCTIFRFNGRRMSNTAPSNRICLFFHFRILSSLVCGTLTDFVTTTN